MPSTKSPTFFTREVAASPKRADSPNIGLDTFFNGIELNDSMEKLTLSDETSIVMTDDLSLRYMDKEFHEHEIPAAEIHSQLTSSGDSLKEAVNKKLTKSGRDAAGDPSANFLMANISFLLSKETKHGKTHVSLPIRIPYQDYFSMRTSWYPDESLDEDAILAGKRSLSAAQRMHARHTKGLQRTVQKTNFGKVQQKGPLGYLNVSGPSFENEFHHSEQALYEYLSRTPVAIALAEQLHQYGLAPETEILSIQIDLHSTRYICGSCELGAHGSFSQEDDFLQNFLPALARHGYKYSPQELTTTPRVSANKPDKGRKRIAKNDTPEQKLLGHRPPELKGRSVFQSDVVHYPLPEVTSDLHRRTAFISSDVSNSSSYTKTFKNLVETEYAEMIAAGQQLKSHNAIVETDPELSLAFNELAMLNTEPSREQQKLASEVRQTREEYEKEILKDNIIDRLHEEAEVPYAKIAELSSEQLLLFGNEEIIELLSFDYLSFDFLSSLTLEKLSALLIPEISSLIKFTETDADSLLENYEDFPNEVEELCFYYDPVELLETGDYSFCDLLDLYLDDPLHIRCLVEETEDLVLEFADDLPEILLQHIKETKPDLSDVRSKLTSGQLDHLDLQLAAYNSEDESDEEEDYEDEARARLQPFAL